MAGTRTLKLSILADTDNLTRNLKSGQQDVETFGDKVTQFGKLAAGAFLAAGAAAAAYAGKLLVDGVKAAIEDEKAQAKLAATIRNTTGATEEQIFAVEDYISSTSIAVGLTDDELRPSFERLLRATRDVTEAMELQTLAIDIAAGTGKSLEAVSQALGKAYEGNLTALGKLGLGIDRATLQSMTFEEVTTTLTKTFGGQAAIAADTYAGKMERLKIAFQEGKETVGSYVLDALQPLADFAINTAIPSLQEMAYELGERLGPIFHDISRFVSEVLLPAFQLWWEYFGVKVIDNVKKVVIPILSGLFDGLKKIGQAFVDNKTDLEPFIAVLATLANFISGTVAPILANVLGKTLSALGTIIAEIIELIATMTRGIRNAIEAVRDLARAIANSALGQAVAAIIPGRANGGPVTAGNPYVVGERGPELFVPRTSGTIIPNGAMRGGNTYNITVNGAIDAEGTARTIYQVLQNSAARTGNYGTLGTSLNSLITA